MLGICFFINLFDGLDLFAMAYAAPVLSETWSLPPESLGIVLSAVFVGMAAGAVLVGPLCDYIGRRKIVLGGTLLISFAMLLTATATSVTELLIYRVLTGLGFGATLPDIASLVAEYSPERFRKHGRQFIACRRAGRAPYWVGSSPPPSSLDSVGRVFSSCRAR